MKPIQAGFPKTFRLNDPREFTRVFETATFSRRSGPLRMMAAANTMHTARVGLVVGKRALRRAVDRNRVKRAIRETFRVNRLDLPHADIVVQVTAPATAPAVREALLTLFDELRNRCQ